MITLEQFHKGVTSFRNAPDQEQRSAIDTAYNNGLFIVAGPGSGKTTCLTLRVLKMILVDGVAPSGVIATTFTKKAAEELRSRILGWGFNLIDALKVDAGVPKKIRDQVAEIDINQVWTGTLDSLCEQILRDHRIPGEQPPVLADEFVSKTLMMRKGLLDGRKDQEPDLSTLLADLWGGTWGLHAAKKGELLTSLWERRHHDLVDWPNWVQSAPSGQLPARQLIDAALSGYAAELQKRNIVDFATVEYLVLERLQAGRLQPWLEGLRVILVDEYQDTNLLQEKIYFQIAKAVRGALTVVGDDDQSLYRFRGATVDLFRGFEKRYQKQFKAAPAKVYLSKNYRSTKAIINFVNAYAQLDKEYQKVRVKGKPSMQPGPASTDGIPIMGMFRRTQDQLAEDLAEFVQQVFRGKGFKSPSGHLIKANPQGGDLGDCAVLCSSPQESKETNNGTEYRLPGLLRVELASKTPAIRLFNPRGQDFHELPVVQRFGGALLESLDPGSNVQSGITYLRDTVSSVLNDWRGSYQSWVSSGSAPQSLVRYVNNWSQRNTGRGGLVWPKGVSCIDLLYGLTHYFPELHNDAEGQVYLEVFTRQLSACEETSGFKSNVVFDPTDPDLSGKSVRDLIGDFLAPIASGLVKVEEEMIDSFPRDQLSVLSIHQSKGLEFPMVIVDIGSEFKRSHPAHAFKRFPSDGAPAHRQENLVRTHSELSVDTRSPTDRAFDDLIRQYFVAYSRPQEVLLLVGLNDATITGRIQNIAVGRDRSGVFYWNDPKVIPMEMI